MSKKLNTGLGRGLSSLLGGDNVSSNPARDASLTPPTHSLTAIQEIDLKNIVPNPLQPRADFDQDKLEELAASIKLLGVIQPITVIRLSVGKYQIISGERRFRASRIAGKTSIPAYIKKDVEDTDGAKLEMALVENVQRDDLDPIEIALSLKRLTEECNLTQEALSQRVGINRATIANYIRLLKLPPEVQLALKKEKLTMGHAKVLLGLDSDKAILSLAEKVVKEELNVRQTEDLVKRALNGAKKPSGAIKPAPSSYAVEIGGIFSKYFKNKVKVEPSKNGGGSVVIKYKNEEELQKFLNTLKEHKL